MNNIIERIEAALNERDLAVSSALLATVPAIAYPAPGSVESHRNRVARALAALADSLVDTPERRVYADPDTGRRWRSIDGPLGVELYEEVV